MRALNERAPYHITSHRKHTKTEAHHSCELEEKKMTKMCERKNAQESVRFCFALLNEKHRRHRLWPGL